MDSGHTYTLIVYLCRNHVVLSHFASLVASKIVDYSNFDISDTRSLNSSRVPELSWHQKARQVKVGTLLSRWSL